MKKLFLLIFIFSIFLKHSSFAHVKHYNNIKSLKYDLYYNNELIGYHTFNFTKKNDILEVNGVGFFKVSKLGIDLMNYKSNSHAIYKENQLIKFKSRTTQNEKKKYVKIDFKENSLNIDGSSFKGKAHRNNLISSLWNHEIVTKNKQISAVSGRIINQKVNYLGKKKININNMTFDALNFHIFSNDNKPLKEKKLNINIWYDSKTLIWVKASYKKFGNWEYRISNIEY